MKKLAIVCSHPIQYYAPLFKLLSNEIELKVFYCHNPSAEEIGIDGFGTAFQWDVDLLEGYSYEFLKNQSKRPSLSQYQGCDTPQIGKAIEKFGASHVVVFGWYLKSFVQVLKYCNSKGIPIAVRGDSQLDPRLPFWKKLIKRLYYPIFLRKYDAFLYVGKRNKEYLRHYGVPERKLIFSPHAVDQNFWTFDPKLGKSDVFTFIWAGKFTDKKRPWDVLEAFTSLYSNDTGVKLNMIGTGEYFDQMLGKFNESDNIHFLGFKNQTELRTEYLQADCLLLSSDYGETWGLVVNEAMACGIPAIVSSACGCSEDMIDEAETGFVYFFADIENLKQKMKKAIQDSKSYYAPYLAKKNEIYSYQRNIQSFQEFLAFSKK